MNFAPEPLDLNGNDAVVKLPALLFSDYSQLIAEVSARLVKSSSENLDAEILNALRQTLLPLGVDRGGLLEVWEDSPVVKLSHAWYREGLEPVSGEINLVELFPWLAHRLVGLGETMAIEKCGELPPEAEVDRQSCTLMGIKSFLDIPLFIGQRVHHIFFLNALQSERHWPDELITHLRLLGEIFVSALQRREVQQELLDSKENLENAAASADAGLWALDLSSGQIWVTEKIRQIFGFDPDLELTLEHFLKEIHLDDRALISAAIDDASRNGDEANIEYRIISANGQVRWMNSRGRLQTGHRFGRRRFMGVTLDVTERKRMEQQVQEQLQEIERLREQLEAENIYLRNEVAAHQGQRSLHGVGRSMQAIKAKIEQVAQTGSTVLIEGETGTGKELVAQCIHRLSNRSKRPMVVVNCAALPAALVESELFGRERGAFTGALSRQVGRFELANDSTLFLDEIGELPQETQVKLLRVLQEGEFERLGNPQTIKVDVRVIAATNRDLAADVEQGRFRRDLYYRLNVFPVHLPPLRERQEEIPELVWEFVNEFNEKMGKRISRVAKRDMEALKAYPWPGNIRELRNIIEHAMIISLGENLELQRSIPEKKQTGKPTSLEEIERRHIQEILAATHGRIKGRGGAAELLELNPSTLYSRMRKLGIPFARSGAL